MNRTVPTLLVALALVLAGCSGAVGPTGEAGGDRPADGSSATTGTEAATVDLYVSDERNAIDDFEHLNVTITGVTFQRADGTRIEHDLAAQTVDLTRLHGENASLVDSRKLENGTYVETVLHVSGVNATLKNGEPADVKIPSGKLRLTKSFTVGNGESIDFVFDITVVQAGKSGKYVLQPVVGESGTDQPIRPVGGDGHHERDGDESAEGTEGDVEIAFSGGSDPGETLVVRVSESGQPVRGVPVEVNGATYRTGDDGTVTVDVPPDADALTVEVEYRDTGAELKREFDEDGSERERERDGERDDRDGPPEHAERDEHDGPPEQAGGDEDEEPENEETEDESDEGRASRA